MTTGDLLYSDTEEALRDGVRQLFADRCPPEQVVRAYDPEPQDFSAVWRTLAAELGVAGLLVPEALGGAGAGAREAAVVMEEIGRAVAPVPFLSSAVLATVALLRAGETETVAALAGGRADRGAGGAAVHRAGRSRRGGQSRCRRAERIGHQRRRCGAGRRAGGTRRRGGRTRVAHRRPHRGRGGGVAR